ncbi:SCP domain-containing protein, partial [Trichostrongylus colubriformis]
MLLLLITVSLLIHEGSAQSDNENLVEELNKIRGKVAKGEYVTPQGTLPPSQSLFKLERNVSLEAYANITTSDCQGVDMTPPGGSLNIYTTTLPIELQSDTMIPIALSAWMSEVDLAHGPIVSSAQQNFVNMMYYKSTQVGCSYQKCDAEGDLYFYTIACAFDQ